MLAFVNAVCGAVDKVPDRRDAFRYDETDRFPIGQDGQDGQDAGLQAAPAHPADQNLLLPLEPEDSLDDDSPIGIIVGDSVTESADRVAAEIVRLLEGATVRDRKTGTRRRARPADIAILFRSRDAHREFELTRRQPGQAAARRGLDGRPTGQRARRCFARRERRRPAVAGR